MAMDLQTRKILFVQEFLSIDNEDTVAFFENLLKEEHEQSEIEPMTSKELEKRVAQSEKDFAEGRYKTSVELLSKY
jgi:hypothetical protein